MNIDILNINMFLVLILLFMSCALNIGGGKDIDDSPATEILGFTYSSGQVVLVGDTLTIT